MEFKPLIYGFTAIVCSALIAFMITPAIRVLAFKIGAVDVPKDNRRMHKKAIPLIGGLAIYIGFTIATLVFTHDITNDVLALLLGGLALIILGIFDDIYDLNAILKFFIQIIVACVAIYLGVLIKGISIFGSYISFGWLSYPVTVLWIVALVNAFNLIDGLDGLSCGICAICCVSMFTVAILMGNITWALTTSILFGACLGFLPYNFNPARIFMGDTGAYFLGYALAIISIEGVIKVSALISFILPLFIFALPLLDTAFAFIRRILKGKPPFSSDREHLHHKLIDLGLTQRQSVGILYSVCGLFGLAAVVYTDVMFGKMKYYKALIIMLSACAVLIINFLLLKDPSTRRHTGFFNDSEDVAQNVKDHESKSHLPGGESSSHTDENKNL